MASFRERIAERLVANGVVKREQLDELIEEATREGRNFIRLLIERELITEPKLAEFLSKELGLPMISLSKFHIDPEVAKQIPERVARQYNLIAFSQLVTASMSPSSFALAAIHVLPVVTRPSASPPRPWFYNSLIVAQFA